MDHLEVVRMMEQAGGKVWEEGKVSLTHKHLLGRRREHICSNSSSRCCRCQEQHWASIPHQHGAAADVCSSCNSNWLNTALTGLHSAC
jgi:hypothetical protein